MKLIAFGHEKGVGKDTAARFLISHLRTTGKFRSVQQRGFADKLKQQCHELYGWAGVMAGDWYEQSSDHRFKKEVVLPLLGKSPRQIWIEYGNKIRDIYPQTWIDYLLHGPLCDVIIVSDCRYPNEADRIRASGGLVFKIERSSVAHSSDVADDALIGYTQWTETLVNDGNLSDLYNKVVLLAEKYL